MNPYPVDPLTISGDEPEDRPEYHPEIAAIRRRWGFDSEPEDRVARPLRPYVVVALVLLAAAVVAMVVQHAR